MQDFLNENSAIWSDGSTDPLKLEMSEANASQISQNLRWTSGSELIFVLNFLIIIMVFYFKIDSQHKLNCTILLHIKTQDNIITNEK